MGLLGREDLLKRQELKIEKVDLGNDEFVYVREMYAIDKDKWEQSMFTQVKVGGKTEIKQNTENFRTKLAVNTVCDEKGVLLFQPNDYVTLSKNIGSARLEIIANAAQKLNFITEEDKETLTKNSEAGEPGDSPINYLSDLE